MRSSDIVIKSRMSAETKRLLYAIKAMRISEELGKGKAWEVYFQNASISAGKIIAKSM